MYAADPQEDDELERARRKLAARRERRLPTGQPHAGAEEDDEDELARARRKLAQRREDLRTLPRLPGVTVEPPPRLPGVTVRSPEPEVGPEAMARGRRQVSRPPARTTGPTPGDVTATTSGAAPRSATYEALPSRPPIRIEAPEEPDRERRAEARREVARMAGLPRIAQEVAAVSQPEALTGPTADEGVAALAEESRRYDRAKIVAAQTRLHKQADEVERRGDFGTANRMRRLAGNIAAYLSAVDATTDVGGSAAATFGATFGATKALQTVAQGSAELPEQLAELGVVDDDGTPLSFTPRTGAKEIAGGFLGGAAGMLAVDLAAAKGLGLVGAAADVMGAARAAAVARRAARAVTPLRTPKIEPPTLASTLRNMRREAAGVAPVFEPPIEAASTTRAIRGAATGQGAMGLQTYHSARAQGMSPADAAGEAVSAAAIGAGMGATAEVGLGALSDAVRATRYGAIVHMRGLASSAVNDLERRGITPRAQLAAAKTPLAIPRVVPSTEAEAMAVPQPEERLAAATRQRPLGPEDRLAEAAAAGAQRPPALIEPASGYRQRTTPNPLGTERARSALSAEEAALGGPELPTAGEVAGRRATRMALGGPEERGRFGLAAGGAALAASGGDESDSDRARLLAGVGLLGAAMFKRRGGAANVELHSFNDPRMALFDRASKEVQEEATLGFGAHVVKPIVQSFAPRAEVQASAGAWFAEGKTTPSRSTLIHFPPDTPVETMLGAVAAASKVARQSALFLDVPRPAEAPTGAPALDIRLPRASVATFQRTLDAIREGRAGWEGATLLTPANGQRASVHIVFDPSVSLDAAHAEARRIEARLRQTFGKDPDIGIFRSDSRYHEAPDYDSLVADAGGTGGARAHAVREAGQFWTAIAENVARSVRARDWQPGPGDPRPRYLGTAIKEADGTVVYSGADRPGAPHAELLYATDAPTFAESATGQRERGYVVQRGDEPPRFVTAEEFSEIGRWVDNPQVRAAARDARQRGYAIRSEDIRDRGGRLAVAGTALAATSTKDEEGEPTISPLGVAAAGLALGTKRLIEGTGTEDVTRALRSRLADYIERLPKRFDTPQSPRAWLEHLQAGGRPYNAVEVTPALRQAFAEAEVRGGKLGRADVLRLVAEHAPGVQVLRGGKRAELRGGSLEGKDPRITQAAAEVARLRYDLDLEEDPADAMSWSDAEVARRARTIAQHRQHNQVEDAAHDRAVAESDYVYSRRSAATDVAQAIGAPRDVVDTVLAAQEDALAAGDEDALWGALRPYYEPHEEGRPGYYAVLYDAGTDTYRPRLVPLAGGGEGLPSNFTLARMEPADREAALRAHAVMLRSANGPDTIWQAERLATHNLSIWYREVRADDWDAYMQQALDRPTGAPIPTLWRPDAPAKAVARGRGIELTLDPRRSFVMEAPDPEFAEPALRYGANAVQYPLYEQATEALQRLGDRVVTYADSEDHPLRNAVWHSRGRTEGVAITVWPWREEEPRTLTAPSLAALRQMVRAYIADELAPAVMPGRLRSAVDFLRETLLSFHVADVAAEAAKAPVTAGAIAAVEAQLHDLRAAEAELAAARAAWRTRGDVRFATLDIAGPASYAAYQRVPGGSRYRELLLKLASGVNPKSEDYLGGHWSEPNVLAHARVEDRVLYAQEFSSAEIDAATRERLGIVAQQGAIEEELRTQFPDLTPGQIAAGDVPREVYDLRDRWRALNDRAQALVEHESALRAAGQSGVVQERPPERVTTMIEVQTDPGARGREMGDLDTEAYAFGQAYTPFPFTASEQGISAAVSASLLDAIDSDSDVFAWATGGNRVRHANLRESAARAVYDVQVPTTVRRLLRSVDHEQPIVQLRIDGADWHGIRLPPELKAAIREKGLPLLPGFFLLPGGIVQSTEPTGEPAIGDPTALYSAIAAVVAGAGLAVGIGEYAALARRIPSAAGLVAIGGAMQQSEDPDLRKYGAGVLMWAGLHGMGMAPWRIVGGRVLAASRALAQQHPLMDRALGYVSPRLVLSDEILRAIDDAKVLRRRGEAEGTRLAKQGAQLGPAADRLVSDVIEGESWEDRQALDPDLVLAAHAVAASYLAVQQDLTRRQIAEGVLPPEVVQRIPGYLKRKYATHLVPDPLAVRTAPGGGPRSWRIEGPKRRTLDVPVYEAQDAVAAAERQLQQAAGDATRTATAQEALRTARQQLQTATEVRNRIRLRLGEVREFSWRAKESIESGYGRLAGAQLLATLRATDAVHPEWVRWADQLQQAEQHFAAALDEPQRAFLREELAGVDTRVTEYTQRLAQLRAEGTIEARGERAQAAHEKLLDQVSSDVLVAQEEAATLRRLIDDSGDAQTRLQARHDAEQARAELGKLRTQLLQDRASQWAQLPESKGYGALAGAIVRRPVADELAGVADFAGWGSALRWWKTSKTVWNPGTHVGNVGSNIVVGHMNGLSVPEQPVWLTRAVRELRAETPLVTDLRARGVIGQSPVFAGTPARPRAQLGELSQLLRTTRPETAQALRDLGVEEPGRMARAREKLGDMNAAARRFYQSEDDVFRVALYMKRRATGRSVDEAASDVQAAYGDFEKASGSRLVRLLRSTAFPFITYQAAAVAPFGRALIEHPYRWLSLTLPLLYLNELGQQEAQHDLTTADVPRRERDTIFGTLIPNLVQLPLPRDERGGVAAIDLTRFTPLSGLVTGAPPGTAPGALDLPGLLAPTGPVVQSAVAVAANRASPFSDQPMLGPYDSPGEVAGKAVDFAEDLLLPAAAGMHRRRLLEDLRQGDTGALPLDVAAFVGARPRYYREGEAARREQRDLRAAEAQDKFETSRRLMESSDTAFTSQLLRDWMARRARRDSLFIERTTPRP